MDLPAHDDIVVREKRGNPSVVYVLGRALAPDQLKYQTRDEAVAKALAFAEHQRVQAWFDHGDDRFTSLGEFRPDDRAPGTRSCVPLAADDRGTPGGRLPDS